ncbi:MAG: hypothetical protein Q7O66_04710 [Dehalococcoidia bacterium]|nr:hypothetical protein [Dehalococcoidia bacterium]
MRGRRIRLPRSAAITATSLGRYDPLVRNRGAAATAGGRYVI